MDPAPGTAGDICWGLVRAVHADPAPRGAPVFAFERTPVPYGEAMVTPLDVATRRFKASVTG